MSYSVVIDEVKQNPLDMPNPVKEKAPVLLNDTDAKIVDQQGNISNEPNKNSSNVNSDKKALNISISEDTENLQPLLSEIEQFSHLFITFKQEQKAQLNKLINLKNYKVLEDELAGKYHLTHSKDLFQASHKKFKTEFTVVDKQRGKIGVTVLAVIKKSIIESDNNAIEKRAEILNCITLWNKVCYLSDKISLRSDYTESVLNIMPKLEALTKKLDEKWLEIRKSKTDRSVLDRQTQAEKDNFEKQVKQKVEAFNELNDMANTVGNQLFTYLKESKLITEAPGQFDKYSDGLEMGPKSKERLQECIKTINNKYAEFRTINLYRDWHYICAQLNDLATQISQYANGAGNKLLHSWGGYDKQVLINNVWVELKPVTFIEAWFKEPV